MLLVRLLTALGLEDSHIPTFGLLLYPKPACLANPKDMILRRAVPGPENNIFFKERSPTTTILVAILPRGSGSGPPKESPVAVLGSQIPLVLRALRLSGPSGYILNHNNNLYPPSHPCQPLKH